jgi:hypothetical protein
LSGAKTEGMHLRVVRDSRRRVGRLMLVALLAVSGCGGAECVTQTTQYTASVSTVGTFGPMNGLPIARFDMTQDFVTHTPYEACAQGPLQDVGIIRLKVTSLANNALALKFDVQGLNPDGLPVWKQALVIPRIGPSETLDLGEVIVTPTQLRNGATIVFSAVTIVN